jgi:hypothetical protein
MHMRRIAGRKVLRIALLLLVVATPGLTAQDSVSFRAIIKTTLRGGPSPVSAALRTLTPGTVVQVIGDPDIRESFVHVTVSPTEVGWVESDDLSLNASDPKLSAELSKLRLVPTLGQEPALIRFDTAYVRHPGGAQAVEQVLLPVYEIVTIRPAAFGVAHPIAPPAMKNFLDGDNWMLREPLRYTIDPTGQVIEVPKGFVTDFASVPPALRSLLGPTGPYGMPAIVHDFLYWSQACSKDQADRLFRLSMEDSQVSSPLRWALFVAVHVFGGRAWRTNRTDRAAGLVRVPPPPDDDVPANTRWPSLRRELKGRGVRERGYPVPSAAACALGGRVQQ